MESYKLVFKRSVANDLRGVPTEDVRRVVMRIETLRKEPRPAGCEKLSTGERNRFRQGRYRILYEIHDHRQQVTIVQVASRGDVRLGRKA